MYFEILGLLSTCRVTLQFQRVMGGIPGCDPLKSGELAGMYMLYNGNFIKAFKQGQHSALYINTKYINISTNIHINKIIIYKTLTFHVNVFDIFDLD
jgi:hypothetical protein